MNITTNSSRAGITLMEVLISIGILSVGLTAVITIIPAAGSQAQKALTESTKANVGLAALDDAITRGILEPPATPPFVIDPIGNEDDNDNGVLDPGEDKNGNNVLDTNAFAGLGLARLDGLAGVAADEVFRSQDDVVYELENSGPDGPPKPFFYTDGVKRASEGVYSWLATLVPQGGAPSGENFMLSVVSFHRRDQTSPTSQDVTRVSDNSVEFSWSGSESFGEIFSRGSVVLVHNTKGPTWEWRRIIFPSFGGGSTCQLMFDADVSIDPDDPQTTTVYAFKGAVGVAERLVRLEGTSPWSQ